MCRACVGASRERDDGLRADKGYPGGPEEHQRSVYRFGG